MTLVAALHYARAGFPVFPCKATSAKDKGSKSPHLPGGTAPGRHDGGHWLATTDTQRVGEWWWRWPDALIGFPTGRRTGTVVVDLDPRETPIKAMVSALRDWCGGGLAGHDAGTGEILSPAVARTQGGGLHLYYAWPGEAELGAIADRVPTFPGEVRNRVGVFKEFLDHGEAPAALAHIDVRAEGGYVIAPPSVMDNGNRYAWERKPARNPGGGWHLPQMPPRLLAVITREWLPRGVVAARKERAEAARRFRGGEIGEPRVRAYVAAAVEGALREARSAPPGQRNQAVFEAAMRLGQFVRGGVLPRAEAEALLLANLPAGVPPGERKIQTTIRNGLTWDQIPAFDPQDLRSAA